MTDLASASGTGLWRCDCKYVNVDVPRCDQCGRPAPAAPPTPPPQDDSPREVSDVRALWDQVHAERVQSGQAPQAREVLEDPRDADQDARSARRTVRWIIIVTFLYVGVVSGTIAGGNFSARQALEINLGSAICLYGGMAIWIGFRSLSLGIEPNWLIGGRRRAILEGVALGGAGAVVVSIALRLISGHTTTDPMAGALVNQDLTVLIFGAVVIAAIGPVVEEIIFRGFLAEAFRSKGPAVALFVSALLFGIAHHNLFELWYYVLMGLGFGALYWRRGLTGSIAAHAAFNGSLIVVAVIAAFGPATTYRADGLAFRLPATWHQVQPGHGELGLSGPGGAQIHVIRYDFPPGSPVSVDRLQTVFADGAQAPAGTDLDRSSVHIEQLPTGPALRFEAVVKGHADEVTVLVLGHSAVEVDFLAEGSSRAVHDADRMWQAVALSP